MKPKNELSNTYAKSIKTIPIQQHTSDPVNAPQKFFQFLFIILTTLDRINLILRII